MPESLRIVSGIVPSRAASVSVKVAGVVTWPLTVSIVDVDGVDVGLARLVVEPVGHGHEQVAVERLERRGCRARPAPVKVSRSARRRL